MRSIVEENIYRQELLKALANRLTYKTGMTPQSLKDKQIAGGSKRGMRVTLQYRIHYEIVDKSITFNEYNTKHDEGL